MLLSTLEIYYDLVLLSDTFFHWNIIDMQSQFLVYNRVVWLLYTLLGEHHSFGYNLSTYKANTILLTLFSMLYFTSPWLIYFISVGWYSMILQPHLQSCVPSPPYGNHQCLSSLYLWVWVLFFCVFGLFLDSTYKWNHVVLFFLSFTYSTA